MRELTWKADWGNEMKTLSLLSCIKLVNWVIICPERSISAHDKFLRHYGDVIRGMGIYAEKPET